MKQEIFEQAFAVAEALEKQGLPSGVESVTVGYKRVGGETTDRPALIFLVREKLRPDAVHPALEIPDEIEGFPTDVVEARAEPQDDGAVDPDARVEPLIGGVRIHSQRKKGTGTLGAIFCHRSTRQPLGLTNRHVVDNWAFNANGKSVYQPVQGAGNRVGVVREHDKSLDCASVTLSLQERAIDRKHSFLGLEGRITAIARAREEMLVFKVGARTGYTEGVVKSSGPSAVEIRPRRGAEATALSDNGDSGAVWACKTADGYVAVALHWGGLPGVASAKPLIEVARLLELDVLDP